jgi:hypothetical protein
VVYDFKYDGLGLATLPTTTLAALSWEYRHALGGRRIDKVTFSIAPPVLTEDDKNRKPMAPRRTRTERLEPQSELWAGLRIDGRSVERRIDCASPIAFAASPSPFGA